VSSGGVTWAELGAVGRVPPELALLVGGEEGGPVCRPASVVLPEAEGQQRVDVRASPAHAARFMRVCITGLCPLSLAPLPTGQPAARNAG
jgi:hypothetical protein